MTDGENETPSVLAVEFYHHVKSKHLNEKLELVTTSIQMVVLSDGRTLGIEEYGIFDTRDVDVDDIDSKLHGYVSWPELLEMLDRFRAEVRN